MYIFNFSFLAQYGGKSYEEQTQKMRKLDTKVFEQRTSKFESYFSRKPLGFEKNLYKSKF